MKSCLIVDDSKVIRMVARKILKELDFDTTEAVDGKEALDACTNDMPDAILLDWNMPVMNGIDFLRARARPVWPTLALHALPRTWTSPGT